MYKKRLHADQKVYPHTRWNFWTFLELWKSDPAQEVGWKKFTLQMSREEWLERLRFTHCVIFKGEGRCFKVEETQFNLNFHQHCCSLTENTQIFTTLLFRWWEGVSFFEDEQQELYILCIFCVFLCLCCGCIEWGGGGFVECQTLGRVRCPQCHRCHKIWQHQNTTWRNAHIDNICCNRYKTKTQTWYILCTPFHIDVN